MRVAVPTALCLLLAAPAVAAAPNNLHVLAINGGGDKLDNFASHLAHLRQLADLLTAAGIPRDHITILASDGSDPAPDLATRDADPDFAWLLQGTRLDPLLRDLTTYENSVLAGLDLRPATLANLTRAIAELRDRVRPGDTVLLYVTDHGTQGKSDPLDNRITLWGEHESISARKLGELLARLPPSVRVVSLMSQCFSGGFAYMHEVRERKRFPTGGTCGYFSSTPDRPAYGCYPEVRGRKAIGHSFEFLTALARRGRFPAAHADVMLADETPDIPLRSSDVYLAEQLARAAGSPGREVAFIDPLVKQAFASGAFAEESRLLDRMARIYTVARPATLADLDTQADALFDFLDQLDSRGKTWEAALGDFDQVALDAFLAQKPSWRGQLAEPALRRLDVAGRRRLALALLAELGPWLMSEPDRGAEAERLISSLNTVEEISYRTEIRVAALFRMRFALTSAAGRVWMKDKPKQRKAVGSLTRCEDLTLMEGKAPPRMEESSDGAKLPPLQDDERRAAAAQPGWLGITFLPVGLDRRKTLGLPDGAARITSVLSRSPAADAGLRTGDIVLAGAGRPFAHPRELRPFIASSTPGATLALEVLRGKNHVQARPVVGATPALPRLKN
jgi:hypothetical protein